MPIEIAIWQIEENSLKRLKFSKLKLEENLQKAIERDISIVSDEFLLIGSQVATSYAKKIDMLAINGEGNLIIIELKRDKTPREVVAQVLDYASWVNESLL